MKKRILSFFLVFVLCLTLIPFSASAANIDTIYNYLKNELGLNTAAACGFLGNIRVESNFEPTAYNGNDSGGTHSYGICQWNDGAAAGDRYGALRTWCSNNGYNYTTLSGQLAFMKHELTSSSYYRLSQLKAVPDTRDGAAQASELVSKYYEGCATSTYETRKNYARTYFDTYAETDALTLAGETYPTVLTKGSKFVLRGTLTSGSSLTTVTVGVFDVNGNFKTGKNNTSPGGTTYDIKTSADASVLFNNLEPGVYIYKIYAKNSKGGSLTREYKFVVLATAETVSNGTYLIQCKSGGYVADVADHSKSSGANVQAATNAKLPSQAWRVTYASEGYYTIQNVYSGMYLDVTGAGNEDRTNIEQFTGNSSDAQKWQILPTGSGYCLVPKCATSRAMDLSESVAGGNMYIYTAHLGANQRFDLVPISASEYQYTVSFNGNGGANAASVTILKGDAVGTLPTSTREEYVFDGWYTAADGGTKISASTVPTGNVTYFAHWTPAGPCYNGHTWDQGVVTKQPACEEDGVRTFTCTVCGKTKTETLPALGHDYETKTIPATCIGYEEITHTCKRCGHVETEIGEINYTEWSTTRPEGIDERLVESKLQYRASDYQTMSTYDPYPGDGWERTDCTLKQTDSGAISYVKSWPAGFSTGNSYYSTYNNTPKAASETETTKVEVSESVQGYLYYHWCRGSYTGGPINRQTRDHRDSDSSGDYYTFHAFYSTTNPATLSSEGADDGSRIYSNGDVCKDTYWYYNVPVYRQTWTSYNKFYSYGRWGTPGAWSDDPIAETPTRKVETQILYRYAQPGAGHVWDNGVVTTQPGCTTEGVKTTTCTVCGTTTTETLPALGHSYENGVCVRCGEMDPNGVPVRIRAMSASGVAGDVIRVPVAVDQNIGFAAFKLQIDCDDALILTDVSKGALLQQAGGTFTRNVNAMTVQWTGSENLTENGTLFELTFKVSDDAQPGSYPITVSLLNGQASSLTNASGKIVHVTMPDGEVQIRVNPDPDPDPNPFIDVAKGKFYYDPVLWAISQDPQITTGVTKTTFVPDRICTRAHVVTFLWRANGCPEPQSMTSKFKDVKDTSKYYYKAVLWANEQGITTGYSDGTFRPDDECTRGQVVTFLWRAKGSPAPTGVTNPFSDVPTGKYYTNAVLWALKNNITQGRTATTFGPDDACTRGHVVTFLYRAYH